MRKTYLFIITVFFSTSIYAADPVILSADRMLDVARGEIVSPATLLIEDGMITAVNPQNLPARARRVELGDMTLLPGLIDVHFHFNAPYETVPIDKFQKTIPDSTITALDQAKRKLRQGFTTIRVIGSHDFIDVAIARASEQGRIEAPHLFPGANMISITGGHADITTGYSPAYELNYRQGVADGVSEVLKAVRYQIKHGATWIKVMATAGVASFSPIIGSQQYSYAELRAIVEEAGRHGIRVAAHAHYEPGIGEAVRAGVASIEHGSIASRKTLQEMKKRGTFMVMTANGINVWKASGKYDTLPKYMQEKFDYVLARKFDTMKMVVDMDVKVAFGTDVAAEYGNNEFELYVDEFGMSEIDAIRTATINAAELLEVTDRGRLETGLLADVVAVPGNPLENITLLEDVRFVMKAGQIYKQHGDI